MIGCSICKSEKDLITHEDSLVVLCVSCINKIRPLVEKYDEDQLTDSQREFIEKLKGVQYVVINGGHGGFGLSREGKIRYLELAGIPYHLEDQPDRDTQNKYGSRVVVDSNQYWSDRDIDRDDPALVQTVRELKIGASAANSALKIVKIPYGVHWEIEEYDGWEWVSEVHRKWQ